MYSAKLYDMQGETINKIFSQRLTEAVAMSGKSYKELADKLGINKSTVSMYVHGKALPSLPTFYNISEILDVSTDFLLGKNDL